MRTRSKVKVRAREQGWVRAISVQGGVALAASDTVDDQGDLESCLQSRWP